MAGRRAFLKAGAFGALAILLVLRPWTRLRTPDLLFATIRGMPPFRVFVGSGALSGGGAVDPMLIGLSGPSRSEADLRLETRLRETACARLLGGWAPGGPVPVTYFTDLRCVNCVAIERILASLTEADAAAIDLKVREFPVFGPTSELAARAALAADAQGAGAAMRSRLRRSVPATSTAAMQAHAVDMGLDPALFARTLSGPAIADRLAEDRAFARMLGVPGTPALLIGRTLVIGVQPRSTLDALIAQEALEGRPSCA